MDSRPFYLQALNDSIRHHWGSSHHLAHVANINHSQLSRILLGHIGISIKMACLFEKYSVASAESLLVNQLKAELEGYRKLSANTEKTQFPFRALIGRPKKAKV